MSSEIELRDQQLQDKIAAIKADIKKAEKSDRKQQDIGELEDEIRDCETYMEMMRMEFRSLAAEDRNKYKESLRKHKADLKQIKNDLEWLKENDTRNQLVGDRKERNLEDVDLDTAEGQMTHGRQLQKESVEALQRTVGVIGDTQQIGRDTAIKVQQQTEQIKKMYDDLFTIDDMLKRSRKIIARMMKRTLSSRYVWLLAFFIVVGIAVIIYFKVK